ncbi:hypothetical protein C0Q70_21341 [Pomacea canaliculata]|uniref:C2H2-type domain-containing protein n=1 Tax=Pomacea canaliculata TaxID=400727 RepID=A0A2T7NC96_POMCA|nr:hypothetical protein C0Q70_21341 [Pomacea canaliculata]
MFSLPSLPCPRLVREETDSVVHSAHHPTGFASGQPSHVTPVGCKEDPLPHNIETNSTNLSFELPKAASTLKPLQTSSCTGPLKRPFPKSGDNAPTKDSDRFHGKLKSKRRSEAGDIPRNRKPGKSFRSGSLTRSTFNVSFRCSDLRKSFKCTQCRYLTDRKNNLKRHVITMHQASTRLLECCGALFSSKAALRDHVTLFHRGGYRCQVCGRNFCRKALLRRHLTVHSGQKDYACAICGYATSHKSNLERHQRVHGRRTVPGVRGQVSLSRLADKGKLNNSRHAEDKEPTRKSLGAKHSSSSKVGVSLDCEHEAESKVTPETELSPGSSENSSSPFPPPVQ